MDDVGEVNIRKLRALGDFWFDRYGSDAVALLMGQYEGPSLNRIDPEEGKPIRIAGVIEDPASENSAH